MQMRSRSCQLFPSPSSPFPAIAAATPPLLYPPLEEEGGEDPLVLFFFFNLAEEEPSSLERLGVVCYLKGEKEGKISVNFASIEAISTALLQIALSPPPLQFR